MSGSSLLLNNHFTGTGFLHIAYTVLLLIVIHAFLDRILFTPEIVDIFDKCTFGLDVAFLGVSGSSVYVEIDVFYTH